MKVPRPPRGLALEQHVHDGLETQHGVAVRMEVLGAREAREQVAQVGRDGSVVERQVVEARPYRALEEPFELHGADHSRFAVRIAAMAERGRFPWVLVAASVILAALLAYTLFWGLVPARQAELQTRLAQIEQRGSGREQAIAVLTAERDSLRGRLADLERQLAISRGSRQ